MAGIGRRLIFTEKTSEVNNKNTPLELHAGYLLGKERIVATHDGNYGWDEPFRYRLWIYDAEGKAEAPAWQDAKNRVAVMERVLN